MTAVCGQGKRSSGPMVPPRISTSGFCVFHPNIDMAISLREM
jgi:hypothetical protein